ncbi:peroxiredoxin [Rubritalea marina]|uniref:peroxiredoxin n=1 Tax=Rubritalea marina TaxID=361055 RepID=UPI0003AAF718|nr:peroxiredoxin [Rubritalea marina]
MMLRGLFQDIFGSGSDGFEAGKSLPSIELCDQAGELVALDAMMAEGLTYVFFYPRAETPVCTAQACGVRDELADFKTRGLRVVGVSADSPHRLAGFAQRHGFDYPLLSDPEGKAMEVFGVKRVFGQFASRRSFLVRDGVILWKADSSIPSRQLAELDAVLRSLEQES